MTSINFNIGNWCEKTKEFAISSKNYIVDTSTECALSTYEYAMEKISDCLVSAYEYAENKLEHARLKVITITPDLVNSAQIATAIVIGGVALKALVNLSTHLPLGETVASTIVAGYALTHPNQCAQAIAIYAIGSVVVKTLALSTCSLPIMEAFALFVATSAITNHLINHVKKVENKE